MRFKALAKHIKPFLKNINVKGGQRPDYNTTSGFVLNTTLVLLYFFRKKWHVCKYVKCLQLFENSSEYRLPIAMI